MQTAQRTGSTPLRERRIVLGKPPNLTPLIFPAITSRSATPTQTELSNRWQFQTGQAISIPEHLGHIPDAATLLPIGSRVHLAISRLSMTLPLETSIARRAGSLHWSPTPTEIKSR